MKKIFLALAVGLLFLPACKDDTTDNPNNNTGNNPVNLDPVEIQLDTLLTGLTRPWGIEFIEDGKILITERSGDLLVWDGTNTQLVTGLPGEIYPQGQGGLLDVRKHPNYESNKLIYFCGSAGQGTSVSTTLYRGVLNGRDLSNVEKLFEATPQNTSGAHFGSRIVFDDKGHVFLSL